MTIQECYQRLGGDYSAAEKRLMREALVKKFITKFLDDGSYAQLCCAMQEGQREEAFRAAHTLKGVCGNLGFDRLYHSASRLTELLRPQADAISEEVGSLMEEVSGDYELTVNAIGDYLSQDTAAE